MTRTLGEWTERDGVVYSRFNEYIFRPDQSTMSVFPSEWRDNARFIAAAGTAAAQVEQLGYNGQATIEALPELLEAALAAIDYDKAILSCANDPAKMASFCTANGDDLDTLYFDWLDKARAAIAKAKGQS